MVRCFVSIGADLNTVRRYEIHQYRRPISRKSIDIFPLVKSCRCIRSNDVPSALCGVRRCRIPVHHSHNSSRWSCWHTVMLDSVEKTAGGFFADAMDMRAPGTWRPLAPLLEEKRHGGTLTLIAQRARPIRMHRP